MRHDQAKELMVLLRNYPGASCKEYPSAVGGWNVHVRMGEVDLTIDTVPSSRELQRRLVEAAAHAWGANHEH